MIYKRKDHPNFEIFSESVYVVQMSSFNVTSDHMYLGRIDSVVNFHDQMN